MSSLKHQIDKIVHNRSLTGLMALYERNYQLLARLVPDFGRLPERAVSRVKGSPDLYLKVEERARYTTTLLLTYYFPDRDGDPVAEPDLHVKAYHDARVVEAVACRKRGFRPLGEEERYRRPVLECTWESNVFLDKWLSYALSLGHGFHPGRIEIPDDAERHDDLPAEVL